MTNDDGFCMFFDTAWVLDGYEIAWPEDVGPDKNQCNRSS